jgi:hypothetical protein
MWRVGRPCWSARSRLTPIRAGTTFCQLPEEDKAGLDGKKTTALMLDRNFAAKP